MVRKSEDKDEINEGTLDLNTYINKGIVAGVEILRGAYGIDMELSQFFEYLDERRVIREVNRLARKWDSGEDALEQAEKFEDELIKYIVEEQPFNRKGTRLLEKSSKALTKKPRFSDWLIYSKNERNEKSRGEHVDAKETAIQIYKAVAANPNHYSAEVPELVGAASRFADALEKSKLADIVKTSPDSKKITQGDYSKTKSELRKAAEAVSELAVKYVKRPLKEAGEYVVNSLEEMVGGGYAPARVISIIMVVIGTGLIFFFNSANMSGAAVGVSSGSSSFPSIIGLILLILGLAGLVFHKK